MLLTDGTVKSVSVTPGASADASAAVSGITMGLYNGAVWKEFRITTTAASSIVTAKVELGSVCTLASDAPMDYGIALLKCQRYYFASVGQFGGYAYSMTAHILVPSPKMRLALVTVVSLSGELILINALMDFTSPTTAVSFNSGVQIDLALAQSSGAANANLNGTVVLSAVL